VDMNKFKDWMDMAKNLHGKDFWSSVFDQPNSNISKNFSDMFQSADSSFPRVDMYSNSIENVIVIELPGLKKNDVHLTIEGANIRIRGVVPTSYPSHKRIMGERFVGEFNRLIPLPEHMNKKDVSARFVDGALILNYPRNEQIHTGDTIDII